MFIRVVLLACFLMSINLAAAEIDMARVDCVAKALGLQIAGVEPDVLAEVTVSNIKCLNIPYITQNSGKLMKSVKVFWYNNFYYIFI